MAIHTRHHIRVYPSHQWKYINQRITTGDMQSFMPLLTLAVHARARVIALGLCVGVCVCVCVCVCLSVCLSVR